VQYLPGGSNMADSPFIPMAGRSINNVLRKLFRSYITAYK
jgi:hypothetical protein